MSTLAPGTPRIASGGQIALWSRAVGRAALISPETLARLEEAAPSPELGPLLRRLDGLGLLAGGRALDRARMIPAASRLVLCLPEVPCLWYPDPFTRTPGGHAFREHRLNTTELAIWRAINGARPVLEIARRLRISPGDVLAFLDELMGPEVQAAQLREAPVTRRDLSLERLVAPERPANERLPHQTGAGGETTLETWHRDGITDAATHFDDRETTVAHAFERPHPALGGRGFGAALYGVLRARGMVRGGTTLEIGPGTGALAEAWTRAHEAAGGPLGLYLRLDQSPVLLAAQDHRNPGTTGVLGSATALPFPDSSLDLVLANEVIADLSAVPWDPDQPVEPGTPAAEVARRVADYELESFPGRALYNLGAWSLVEELARALRPGGAAYLSEFGGPDEQPTETAQLDHPEVSICFGHLAAVARARGLEPTLLPLPELLGMDLGASWLWRPSYEALRARLAREGRRLEARAWTEDTLDLPWPVEGLVWTTLADPGPGPLPTRFWALLLRKG